jgi:hypothetical protein
MLGMFWLAETHVRILLNASAKRATSQRKPAAAARWMWVLDRLSSMNIRVARPTFFAAIPRAATMLNGPSGM